MGVLRDDPALRDRIGVFEDRWDAGRMLVRYLRDYAGTDCLILAIPAGGLAVAVPVAQILKLPLDLIIARKVQIPYNPEAGFGAVAPDGETIFNNALLRQLHLSQEETRRQVRLAVASIERRNERFRGGRPPADVVGKCVVLVDDGLASGYTMRASIRWATKQGASKIVAAVPTGARETVESVLPEVAELVCLNVRSGYPFAVADAYRHWRDLDDDDVMTLFEGVRGE